MGLMQEQYWLLQLWVNQWCGPGCGWQQQMNPSCYSRKRGALLLHGDQTIGILDPTLIASFLALSGLSCDIIWTTYDITRALIPGKLCKPGTARRLGDTSCSTSPFQTCGRSAEQLGGLIITACQGLIPAAHPLLVVFLFRFYNCRHYN